VEEVLHLADAVDFHRRLAERLDEALVRDLAAQVDDAVLCIDVDVALRDIGVAEELRLDLGRERRVVGLLLRPLLEVRGLLRHAVGLRLDGLSGAAGLAAGAAEEGEHPVASHVATTVARLRIEEICKRRTHCGAKSE
jgi:hypothetical protein